MKQTTPEYITDMINLLTGQCVRPAHLGLQSLVKLAHYFENKGRDSYTLEDISFTYDYVQHRLDKLDEGRIRVIKLLVGSYVGEVIRRSRPNEYTWVEFRTVAKHMGFTDKVKIEEVNTASPYVLFCENTSTVIPTIIWSIHDFPMLMTRINETFKAGVEESNK